jgi:hypothetical protein
MWGCGCVRTSLGICGGVDSRGDVFQARQATTTEGSSLCNMCSVSE